MKATSMLGFAAGGLGLLWLVAARPVARVREPGIPEPEREPAAPLPGTPRASSGFGWRSDPFTGRRTFHPGLDLPVPVGTPVYAPLPGEIVRIDRAGVGHGVINGNAVFLRSPDHVWVFLHLSVVAVSVGSTVQRGQMLGRSGQTGRATGPHLHVQVYDPSGQLVDPLSAYPHGTFAGRIA